MNNKTNIEEDIEILNSIVKVNKDYLKDVENQTINQREIQAIENILQAYKQAYAKANNYLYFADSSDYEVGLWEVIRSLRPDLAEKWDNGESPNLKYIKEEQ